MTAVYLDTNAIIAIIEGPPSDDTGVQRYWTRCLGGDSLRFRTSELSFAELLVVPCREGNRSLADDYIGFLQEEIITVHPVGRAVLDVAAVIRSARRMKLPDAIHLATATSARCSDFLTFDTGVSDLHARRHPLYPSVQLSPVKIFRPDPVSLSELTQALP